MKRIILYLIILTVVLIACSGTDKIMVDKVPPLKPILRPHLGDLGDPPIVYNDGALEITDENNGIDAYPDGNFIRLNWDHLLDTDLDFVKIFRFDELNPIPNHIATIRAYTIGDYVDNFIDTSPDLSTHLKYSYYIEVFDNAGNSTVSDTVSYELLDKPILREPLPNAVTNPNNITFKWSPSGFASKYRLLLFKVDDDNNQYLWHRDLDVSFEGDSLELTGPANLAQLNPGNVIVWRVDSFEWDEELQFYKGAESREQTLYLQYAKNNPDKPSNKGLTFPSLHRYHELYPKPPGKNSGGFGRLRDILSGKK